MRNDQKYTKNKNQNNFKYRLSALLLAGALTLSGCGLPEEVRSLGEALGNFLNPTKSTEEIFSSSGPTIQEILEQKQEQAAPQEHAGEASDSSTQPKQIFSMNPLEWSEDYQDKLSTKASLFQNAATWYYYYTQLGEEEQRLYDALWAIVQDPTSTEYHKKVELSVDPASADFETMIARSYEALIFDHPELFWFRQSEGNFKYYYMTTPNTTGTYTVMVQLTKVYENYEAEMNAFNAAVDAFLAEIDRTQSQPMMALQIHDKLIDLVHYDNVLAGQLIAADNSYDYGYSAYGALVANSRGEANTAVCDGYSYAYEYLLQQVGIPVTRVGGFAGDSVDTLQPHSWNLVSYDGEWYEVDATWNDQDTENYDASNPIVAEAVSNTAYWNRLRHFMYNLTTEQITNYEPDFTYTYYASQGYVTFLSSSLHVRDDGSNTDATQDYLSCLAPTATGTTYTYDALMGY